MSKNWEYAASLLWPILTTAAKDRRKPIYKELAPLINTNPLSVGNALEPIQAYCMEYKLPPLSAIVVGKNTGLPGGGFIAWDIEDIDSAFEKVFNHPWETVQNPFFGFTEHDSIETLSNEIINNPNKAKEIYTKVKVRGTAQHIFRETLLKAYESRCAICGFSFKQALEAAHIVPWSKAKPEERISPSNGVLLCSNHHKLFDEGIIQITNQLQVHHPKKQSHYSKADIAATVVLDTKSLQLPKNINLWPSLHLINRRNQTYQKQ
ncbi:HNH endonuclease signature motif containing protein [uncultured Methylophaga sp.]|uniref:HNH endonuclease n=1 Tax=uncultured Methylophaga sp. TaxID=285271 RepID=UPI00260C03E3|nr:HNH endonuclease signature motif containing protein [uncultured Methylophaga sp.]